MYFYNNIAVPDEPESELEPASQAEPSSQDASGSEANATSQGVPAPTPLLLPASTIDFTSRILRATDGTTPRTPSRLPVEEPGKI